VCDEDETMSTIHVFSFSIMVTVGCCGETAGHGAPEKFARNPEFDPLENVFNRSIRRRESTTPTPTLESRKYFTVVVHHCNEADGTGIFRNEAILAIDETVGKAASSLEQRNKLTKRQSCLFSLVKATDGATDKAVSSLERK
jgi:hypothetical protein